MDNQPTTHDNASRITQFDATVRRREKMRQKGVATRPAPDARQSRHQW